MNKRPFRCRVYGEGEPLVLIPGLDGLTEFFSDLVPELARHYRVVLYELPLRAEADARGLAYTFEYLAQDLGETLDEVGVADAHVVGESFGGVVAQMFALTAPARLRSLTLISSAPHFDVSAKNRFLLKLMPLSPMWLFARIHLADVCLKDDPAWAKRLFVKGASYADHASVMARARIVSRVDLRERVAQLRCPMLLVVGSRDAFTGAASLDLGRRVPHARMVTIEGGHLCHMTNPKAFLGALMPFLAEHGRPASAGRPRPASPPS
jgi:pimeloyl-ACP methyl ester carboxylesterase